MHAERADASETLMSVEIPEVPGSFRRFISHIEPRNITEFSYRYGDTQRACVYASFQAIKDDPADASKVMQALRDDGCSVLELTGNELAKAHVRHLVGGRAPQGTDELLFRFEFPERPGALTKFLDSLEGGWNVSLFHYRNHGADIGRVLVGLQVPPEEQPQLQSFLDRVGYVGYPETDNAVYKQFLR